MKMNSIHIGLVYALWFIVTFFFMVIVLSIIKNRNEFFNEPKPLAKEDIITILVPAFNEEKTIADTIESLLRLDYPSHLLDIIVLNDGSTDKTGQIAAEYAQRGDIRLIENRINQGKAKSLNIGIKEAKGELIATLDADTVIEGDILTKVGGYFRDEDVGSVIVRVRVREPKNWLEKIIEMEYNMGLGFYLKLLSFLNCLYLTPGQFSLYRKKMLDELRGFDVDNIVEDTEIAYRMQKKGYKIACCLSTYAYTKVPNNIRAFYYQRRRWYSGTIQTILKHRDVFFNRELGNFGMFFMPVNYGSIIIGTFLFISTIFLIGQTLYDYFIYYSLIDFDIIGSLMNYLSNVEFDPLMISIFYFLGISPFIMNALINFFAIRKMGESFRELFFGFICFLFFFIPYNTLWIICAYMVARNKNIKWRN